MGGISFLKNLLAGILLGLFGCDCSFLPSGVPLELILKKLGPSPKEGLYYGSVSDCASISLSPQHHLIHISITLAVIKMLMPGEGDYFVVVE